MNSLKSLLLLGLMTVLCCHAVAQNPFITDQFTADPTARVFNDRVYVFPSHDIRCEEGQGRGPTWFCMEDYHVFSSDDLTDWTDHGMIVSQNDVQWADTNTYSMWAPDCIERNGKYYFYFPTIIRDTVKYWRGYGIGVAIADKPEGPYSVEPEPIENVRGIDPNIFIDEDGQAYLYWSQGHIFGAKLKENMLELASEPKILGDLPALDKGLKEGPFVFERNGIYYMTYPHVENKTERLEYAIGDNPLGPFKFAGVIMDESPSGCWTNHHSIIEFKDQWYLFYHHNDLSPDFDKNRSIRVDSLFFNKDGTIQKVIPTLRGVGVTDAFDKIQLDRFSEKSQGASVDFLDSLDTFKGWKTVLGQTGAWIKYGAVDFGSGKAKSVAFRAASPNGGLVQLRVGSADGPLLSTIKIKKGQKWRIFSADLQQSLTGVNDLVVVQEGNQLVEIDWIEFTE